MAQSASSVSNKEPYMIFRLGGRKFAVPISNVLEVIEGNNLTTLPQTSDYVVGISNCRGKVIPIINTLKRLSLPADNNQSGNGYIVVFEVETDFGNKTFGATVDKVLSVGDFLRSEIKEMDVLQPGVSSTTYIKGVIECDGEYVLVVMPSKFISADDFSDISKMVSDNIWNNNNSNNVSKA